MAFNDKEQEIIKYGVANGKSSAEIQEAVTRLRTGMGPVAQTVAPVQGQGFVATIKDIPSDIGNAFTGSVEAVTKGMETAQEAKQQVYDGQISPLAGTAKTIGGGLRAGASVIGEALMGLGKLFTSPFREQAIAGGVAEGAKSIAQSEPVKALMQKYETLSPEQKATVDGFLGTTEGLTTMFGVGPAVRAVRTGVSTVASKGAELAVEGATKAKQATDTAIEAGGNLIEKAKPLIKPQNTPEQAIRQIGQGKPDDLKPVQTALETIDTTGVTTFKDLNTRLSDKIPELSRQVDVELDKDKGIYTLKQLEAKATSQGGKVVSTDYVTRALDDLAALYKATGDAVSLRNIQETIARAKKNGLTRKEVNNISRQYGSEFGSKAFSKTGDPLTSTNAQAFENTRSGLKGVARQGLGGPEARALDQKLSALYDTQKLITKNVEAVNKLQQRIQERGLVEKAGYYIAKYADIVTGGSIRGFVGGILPRGAGYKVMNALDIEAALRSNLDIVEAALKTKTDAELLNVLQNATP